MLTDVDKKSGSPFSRKMPVIQEISKLCNMFELTDTGKQRNPDGEKFTWRNKSFKIQHCLDYFLISRQLMNLTNKCTIVFAPETEHSAIFIYLKSAELKQKNVQVFGNLISHSFTMKLTCHCSTKNCKFQAKVHWCRRLELRWDLIKMEIRGFTVKYSKNKSTEGNPTESILQNCINDLFKRAEAEPNNKHIICEIQRIRLRLKKIM